MLRTIRQLHLYLGVFFAPAIIFFAFSGIFQTLGLHESKDRSNPVPMWIAEIASVHKDQHFAKPKKPHNDAEEAAQATHHDDADTSPAAKAQEHHHDESSTSTPLKIFVVLMAASLISTSFLGLYMAVSNIRTRSIAYVAFIAGLILPMVLLYL